LICLNKINPSKNKKKLAFSEKPAFKNAKNEFLTSKNDKIMKTIVNNKTQLQTQNVFSKDFALNRAIVTEIEYDNGKTGELMSFFKEETDFEVIVSGLQQGLARQSNVSSVKFTVCSFSNGVFDPYIFYGKKQFTIDEKMKATNGAYFFHLKRKAKNDLGKAIEELVLENNILHNKAS
jgi:hypothetical protein